MLEILLLIYLGKRIGAIARSKGRTAAWYQVLLCALWFGGEAAGGITGVMLTPSHQVEPGAYLAALIGAALGATAAFILVKNLPSALESDRAATAFPVVQDKSRSDAT